MMVSLFERNYFTLLLSTLLMGHKKTMIMIMLNGDWTGHGICLWWLSQQGCLVVLVPSVSIKDRLL
jgi:hypothetical protein